MSGTESTNTDEWPELGSFRVAIVTAVLAAGDRTPEILSPPPALATDAE